MGVAGGFLAPSLMGVVVFMGLPFGDVMRRSFLDAVGRAFVGVENYKIVWGNGAFRLAAGNMLRFLLRFRCFLWYPLCCLCWFFRLEGGFLRQAWCCRW